MAFYAITFAHHDLELRAAWVAPHIQWLHDMVARGFIVASGPLANGPLAHTAPIAALVIVRAESKGAALALVATDPFYVHGVTDGMTITEWNPLFGDYAAQVGGPEPVRTS